MYTGILVWRGVKKSTCDKKKGRKTTVISSNRLAVITEIKDSKSMKFQSICVQVCFTGSPSTAMTFKNYIGQPRMISTVEVRNDLLTLPHENIRNISIIPKSVFNDPAILYFAYCLYPLQSLSSSWKLGKPSSRRYVQDDTTWITNCFGKWI